ncbi:MAG: DUF2726 domain-containing protein [Candidatus Electrothrix sp. YB6]
MNQTAKNEPPGCLGILLKLFGVKAPAKKKLPYARKDYLFSRAERSFFGVLQQAVGSELLIFAKIRLADLLYIKKGTENRQSFFNRIQSKHIDFVLCEPGPIRPVLAIELDDSSHDRKSRQARDAFVDDALAAAGLPILRVRARASYSPDKLAGSIKNAMSQEDST